MPEDKALPPPPEKYFEIETAKLHGGWPVWVRLDPQMRAELLAHELHKNMRDHYYYDLRKPGETVEKPKMPMAHELMRKKFFGG